jgi:uncharacterized protein YkwD
LRKVAVAVLGLPVLLQVYVTTLARRARRVRVGAAIIVATAIGLGLMGGPPAQETVATAPTRPVPLTAAAFTTNLQTDQAARAPITLRFSMPMDPTSVAAHLSIEPATPVTLSWDEQRRNLTLAPEDVWAAGRFHTISVQPGALAESGRPLSTAVRAAFLTRPAASGRIVPTAGAGDRVMLSSSFILRFDRSLDRASMIGALKIEPPVEGLLAPSDGGLGGEWIFTPDVPLAPDSVYTLSLDASVRDADGSPLVEPVVLSVRTAGIPQVVRFRPRDGQKDIDRGAVLSVRFTEAMDPLVTREAFQVTADGASVAGRISFAEGDTVLVFKPAASFGHGQVIVMRVSADARSAAGAPLAEAVTATVTTEPKPPPKVAPKPLQKPPSGGGSAGSGTWAAVETYYLRLMNCTRTGGLVNGAGVCTNPGGRDVAPLILDPGISSRVSRPYAQLLATRGLCSHFIGGSPSDRLRRAGYTSHAWAENLGCRSGDPYQAVLGSHLYFQGERSWTPQGGHYVNLMNATYDRAGIGVWVASGRVRLVVSFYHP